MWKKLATGAACLAAITAAGAIPAARAAPEPAVETPGVEDTLAEVAAEGGVAAAGPEGTAPELSLIHI